MTETALKIWLGFHDIKCDFILVCKTKAFQAIDKAIQE